MYKKNISMVFYKPVLNINSTKILPLTGIVIFILLYPCNLIGFSLRNGISTPAVPFGLAAIALTFLSTIICLFRLLKVRLCNKTMFFMVLFGLFITLIFIRILTNSEAFFSDYYLIFKYIIYFSAGLHIGYSMFCYPFQKIFISTYLLVVITLIAFVDFKQFQFTLLETGDLQYFRISEPFILCSLGVLTFTRKFVSFLITFVISVILLFLINSRFALMGFFCISLLIVSLRFKIKGFTITMACILLSIFYLLNSLYLNPDFFYSNRVFKLAFRTDDDNSLSLRKEFHDRGIDAISKNWFFGDFRGQVEDGSYGSYIHNILSYWRQYGIIPFLLLVFLITIALGNITKLIFYSNGGDNASILFSFSLLSYNILGLILSKSFFYCEIFTSLGVTLALIHHNNKIILLKTSQIYLKNRL